MGVSKKCSKCFEVKSIAYFYKQKNGLYGRTGECKDCRKQRTKKWTSENKERKSETNKKWYKNTDRSIYNAEWRKKNPDYFVTYYKQNREIRLAANRRFWENHPERYECYKLYTAARKSGKLINPNQCQMCGEKHEKIQAHHFDYTKPLEVTWICIVCHKDIHRKKRFTNATIA